MQALNQDTSAHYMTEQVNENGEKFVLCKNCREKIFFGNRALRKLGELCSAECERENAEFYE